VCCSVLQCFAVRRGAFVTPHDEPASDFFNVGCMGIGMSLRRSDTLGDMGTGVVECVAVCCNVLPCVCDSSLGGMSTGVSECVYTYTFICIYMYVYAFIRMYLFVNMHVHLRVNVCESVCVRMFVWKCICMCVCVCVCGRACV